MVGAGSLGLQGQAEGPGLVQPGDEMASRGNLSPPASRRRLSKAPNQALQRCMVGGQETNTGNRKKSGSDWI